MENSVDASKKKMFVKFTVHNISTGYAANVANLFWQEHSVLNFV